MTSRVWFACGLFLTTSAGLFGPGRAQAQQAAPAIPAPATPAPATPAPAAAPAPADSAKPEPLVILFDLGSASVRPQDYAVLDKASRLYTEANPTVMIVTGATDTVGTAAFNLELSERRAAAVLHGLMARGIPADHFQVLAKGGTDPAIPTPKGVDEPRNRRVEIAWR